MRQNRIFALIKAILLSAFHLEAPEGISFQRVGLMYVHLHSSCTKIGILVIIFQLEEGKYVAKYMFILNNSQIHNIQKFRLFKDSTGC